MGHLRDRMRGGPWNPDSLQKGGLPKPKYLSASRSFSRGGRLDTFSRRPLSLTQGDHEGRGQEPLTARRSSQVTAP